MEYTKKVKILAVLIVILTSTYVAGIVFSSSNIHKRRSSEKLIEEKILENISSIRIDIQDGFVHLQKSDEGWHYTKDGNTFPAAKDKIDNFIDSVSNITKYQLAGSDDKSWNKFDLAADKSKKAVFYDKDNNELFTLHIGKSGPVEGSGEYVRTSFSPEVYQLDASIVRYFIRDYSYWSNLRILPEGIQNSSISSVKVNSLFRFEKSTLSVDFHIVRELAGEQPEWKNMIVDKPLDSYGVGLMLNMITSIVGDSFTEEKITEPDTIIEIESDTHGKIVIEAQSYGEEEYIARIRGRELYYLLTTYRIERILNSINSMYESN